MKYIFRLKLTIFLCNDCKITALSGCIISMVTYKSIIKKWKMYLYRGWTAALDLDKCFQLHQTHTSCQGIWYEFCCKLSANSCSFGNTRGEQLVYLNTKQPNKLKLIYQGSQIKSFFYHVMNNCDPIFFKGRWLHCLEVATLHLIAPSSFKHWKCLLCRHIFDQLFFYNLLYIGLFTTQVLS